VFPIAGPPCFLDDELFELNDIAGDEGNIFPDQSVFMTEYAKIGRDNGVVLLPGTVATLGEETCEAVQPVDDIDAFFAGKREYLEAYAERQRPVIEAAKAFWRHPEVDVLAGMKARIEPLLEESICLATGSADRCGFDLAGDDGEVESIVVDFPGKESARAPTRSPLTGSVCIGPWSSTCSSSTRWTGSTRCSVVSLLGGADRAVQRVRLRVLQVPVRGAAAVRRGLVRRAPAPRRRRGRHARRLGRAAALPASQGGT